MKRKRNTDAEFLKAAENGNTLLLRKLLDEGQDPNVRDVRGRTALIRVIYFAIRRAHCSPTISWVGAVRLLLADERVNVNLQDNSGDTALMLTACLPESNNSLEIFQLLLGHKNLNINLQDGFGWTALMYACCKDSVEMVRLLLAKKDVNVKLQSKGGLAVLRLASRYLNTNSSLETIMLLLSRDDVSLDQELVIFSHSHYVDIMLFVTKDSVIPRDVRRMIFLRRRFDELKEMDELPFAHLVGIPRKVSANAPNLRQLISDVIFTGGIYTNDAAAFIK